MRWPLSLTKAGTWLYGLLSFYGWSDVLDEAFLIVSGLGTVRSVLLVVVGGGGYQGLNSLMRLHLLSVQLVC